MTKMNWRDDKKCYRKSISVNGKEIYKYYYFPNTAKGKEQAIRAYLADKAELTGGTKRASEHCRKQLQRVQRYLEAYDKTSPLLPLVADMTLNMQLSQSQTELLKVLRLGENILERMQEPDEVIEFIKLLSIDWMTTEYCLPDNWLNRVQLVDNIQQSQTIEYWLNDYKQDSMRPNKLEPYSISAIHNQISTFEKWIDKKSPIQIIDNNLCKRFEDYLNTLELATDTRISYFRALSSFCSHLAIQDNLKFTKPPILSKKQVRFKNEKSTSETRLDKKEKLWTVEEFRAALEVLPDNQKLWILLSLNCGMRNVDLADIEWKNLKGNRLCYQRHKLRSRQNAPTINYKLWKQTADLIKKLPKKSDKILLTARGLELIDYTKKVKGVLRPFDRAKDWWDGNKETYNLKRMDYLRKTGATFVARIDKGLTRMYLAETLTGYEEIHYAFLDGEINESLDAVTDKMEKYFLG